MSVTRIVYGLLHSIVFYYASDLCCHLHNRCCQAVSLLNCQSYSVYKLWTLTVVVLYKNTFSEYFCHFYVGGWRTASNWRMYSSTWLYTAATNRMLMLSCVYGLDYVVLCFRVHLDTVIWHQITSKYNKIAKIERMSVDYISLAGVKTSTRLSWQPKMFILKATEIVLLKVHVFPHAMTTESHPGMAKYIIRPCRSSKHRKQGVKIKSCIATESVSDDRHGLMRDLNSDALWDISDLCLTPSGVKTTRPTSLINVMFSFIFSFPHSLAIFLSACSGY